MCKHKRIPDSCTPTCDSDVDQMGPRLICLHIKLNKNIHQSTAV